MDGHPALSTTSAITKDPPLFWCKLESMFSVDMLLQHGEVRGLNIQNIDILMYDPAFSSF